MYTDKCADTSKRRFGFSGCAASPALPGCGTRILRRALGRRLHSATAAPAPSRCSRRRRRATLQLFGFPPSRPNPFSCRRRRLERARTLSKYRPRRHMSAEGDGFEIPRPKGWSRGGLQAITPIAHFRLSVGRGFIPAEEFCGCCPILRRGQDPAQQPSGTDKFPGYNVGISLPTFFAKKVGVKKVGGTCHFRGWHGIIKATEDRRRAVRLRRPAPKEVAS